MPVRDPKYFDQGIPEITGAFQIDVVARFDDVTAGAWQRIFDFGDGAGANNIVLSQYENTSDLIFTIYQGGLSYSVVAPEAIVDGQVATWSASIDDDGIMRLAKDGMVLAEGEGVVPDAAPRASALLGRSNWAGDSDLDGAVMGIHVSDASQPETFEGDGLLNDSGSISGAFQLDAAVRFDDVQDLSFIGQPTGQMVYQAENAAGTERIALFQLASSRDVIFQYERDGVTYQLEAEDALPLSEQSSDVAYWSISVDAGGVMRLERDGELLGELQAVPLSGDALEQVEIGGSGAQALDGLVLDLAIAPLDDGQADDPDDQDEPAPDGGDSDPDPTPIDPESTDPDPDPVIPDLETSDGPVQINGAFQLDVTARFDAIETATWQRIFDFGDGPGTNNILLTQYENTSDLMLQLWQDGDVFSVRAEGAIVSGEMADWSVGIDELGQMWIAKNGVLLAEGEGVVPADVERSNLLVGQSNWAEDADLQGAVTAISITQGTGLATPEDPVDPEPADPDPVDPDPVDPDPVDPDPVDPDPVDPDPADDASERGHMFIVAHQDDDLLFMNPTLNEAIESDVPVTTVYLTAGDFGLDQDYWGARESGEKDAYGLMAGDTDWVDETVTINSGDADMTVASSYLASQPDIRLYFLRLPDGFNGGGSERYGFESLEQLWTGEAAELRTVDGSESYSAEQLTGVLTSLMERHTPDRIHIQDHESEHSGIEHSDHIHSAEFASLASENYGAGGTLISYNGYATWGFDENLTPDELIVVEQAFAAYSDDDPYVFGSDGNLLESYVEWLQREYVAYEEELPVLPVLEAAAAEDEVQRLSGEEDAAAACTCMVCMLCSGGSGAALAS